MNFVYGWWIVVCLIQHGGDGYIKKVGAVFVFGSKFDRIRVTFTRTCLVVFTLRDKMQLTGLIETW